MLELSFWGLFAGIFSAGSWAVASHLFSRIFAAPDPPSASAAVLFKNVLATVLFFIIGAAIGDGGVPSGAVTQMLISGLLGFAIGDAMYFAALPMCGVQTTAVVSLANVPLTVIGAHWLFGDVMDSGSLVGGGLVLAGVLLVLRSGGGGGSLDPKIRRRGAMIAAVNALAITAAILSGHEGMQGAGVFTGAGMRLTGGVIGAFMLATVLGVISRGSPVTGVGREFAELAKPFRRRAGLRALLIASITGSVLGLVPYHLALRELPAGVAALVFSTTPLFTLPFARLGVAGARRTTPSLIIGTLLGFAGVGVVLYAQSCGTAEEPAPTVESGAVQVQSAVEGPAGRFPRVADAGRVLATRSLGDGEHALIATRLQLEGDQLSFEEEQSLVEGSDWFVNWADSPAISSAGELVTWLKKAEAGTYDYHVQYALRQEDGEFAEQGPVHEDTGPGEHGFASLATLDQGGVLAVWLDGRLMGDKGPMTLMSRVLYGDGRRGPESVLDGKTCECCPTSLIVLDDGSALVAWRDRSDEGLRDIQLARWSEADGWSEPFSVHKDNWEYPACPVNGPALAVDGEEVALAWYTEDAEGVSRIQVCLSEDGGQSFGPARQIDRGAAKGQISACFDQQGRLLVSWLESTETGGAWVVRTIGSELGSIQTVATVTGKRSDGCARLLALPKGWGLVWTDVEQGRIMGASIR
ncbi:MAG: DMT family transporter [Planctomycetota bacterium]|nr:DMT family transporter [Planctomycetota bacterium]